MMQMTPYAIERAPSQVAALTVTRVSRLAERGRMEMMCLEEAGSWLRRGQALHRLAFEDPGWKAVEETRGRVQQKIDQKARFRVVIEFLRMLADGAEPETTAAFLGLDQQDQETAATLRNQWPDTAASMIRALEREKETERLDMERHEERLKRAFLCFQTGYSLDPYNRELNFILAEYYSDGLGTDRDEERSLFFLRRSAELGHTGAQRVLTHRYTSAHNTPERELGWFPRPANGSPTRASYRSQCMAS
jgi:hypothetical protein